MAFELHHRHQTDGVISVAVNPGAIMTGLQKNLSVEESGTLGWLKPDGTPIDIFKTPAQGAATSAWAATAPEIASLGGSYLENCSVGQPAEPTNRISGYSAHIANPETANRLWEISRDMVNGVTRV
jgi:hypothetical protein